MNRSREKTNSITELVKIVAREIFEELMNKRFRHNTKWRDEIQDTITNHHAALEKMEAKFNIIFHTIRHGKFFKNEPYSDYKKRIKVKPVRHGEPWNHNEDMLLVDEYNIAIHKIAISHGRSIGGIKGRIAQKEINYK